MRVTKNLVLVMVLMAMVSMNLVAVDSDVEPGWKIYKLDAFSVAFPPDWSGDKETQVFGPGKVDMSQGIPDLSVHCGAFPIMPGKTLQTALQSHVHGNAKKEKVTIDGLAGYKCTWSYMSKKFVGVFLEKSGGGMGMMNFIKCSSPKDKYNTYSETFEKIMNSYKK